MIFFEEDQAIEVRIEIIRTRLGCQNDFNKNLDVIQMTNLFLIRLCTERYDRKPFEHIYNRRFYRAVSNSSVTETTLKFDRL